MKKSFYIVAAVLIFGVFLGFSNNDGPKNISDKYTKSKSVDKIKHIPVTTDNNNPNAPTTAYYTDDFDAANDSAGLVARGYLIYRNGTSSGSALPFTWFQGVPTVFNAFNGADSSYVASNYQTAGNAGDIDNWLVLPALNVLTGDSICFYSKSPTGSTFPDSIRVMYNSLGNTAPGDPGWVELGRFKVSTAGPWELNGFMAPGSGAGARFAIRYSVVDAGLFGNNSDFIGVDALQCKRDQPLPVELASFTSIVTNRDVKLNWTTTTESNNSGFEIERNTNGQWSKVSFISGNGNSSSPKNYTFTDRNLNSGKYNYRLKQIDFNGNFAYYNLSNEVVVGIPVNFVLSQNYPNPFNPSTKIEYQLPVDGNVSISVFDNSGREVMKVVNEFKTAGYYTANLNAANLSSGIYFYSIKTSNFTDTKKMMLIK